LRTFTKIAKKIDKLNAKAMLFSGILCILLVIVTAEQVVARYLFNSTSIGLQELQWHLFGILFLLGIAHTHKKNGHVRVDIIYERLSEKKRTYIDLAGSFLFVIPMCLILIFYGTQYCVQSFAFDNPLATTGNEIEKILYSTVFAGESSPDPGGLPARWILKAFVPISMILLLLQTISMIIKNIIKLRILK
jgi:TRAP-type mannitol/chloroaromatic compound transport system permease small subunit